VTVAERLSPAPPVEVVARRLQEVRDRIERAGRDPETVSIVAVTKGFEAAAAEAALTVGVGDIGENYAAELLEKASALPPGVHWHYLGAIQRRRVKRLAAVVSWWETVCRFTEGEEIARRAPGSVVLVEVDVTGAPGRNGCPPEAVAGLVGELKTLPLQVRGLMVVAPHGTPEEARPVFREVARLAAELELPELSMGMSEDLDVAAAEGATMVRIGRALFGERP
jgi:pyridoxal phosphate enzyme (YggS family)